MSNESNFGSGKQMIIDTLKDKASTKQEIYRITQDVFQQFKAIAQDTSEMLHEQVTVQNPDVEVGYRDNGMFEAELKFSGDVLFFSMHSNVFNFHESHFVQKTKYVQEDPDRTYCGVIHIYNFLSDSLKYHRYDDVGYMIARIFINKDRHFFIEGKRQLGFLYNDFENAVINEVYIRAIIESAILYAIDFDLLVPPYGEIQELTVRDKITEAGVTAIKTGKRLGFRFQSDSDGPEG